MNKFRIIIGVIIFSFFSCYPNLKATILEYNIPFHLIDDMVIVEVSINGSPPVNFIFDTGTTTSLIDSITAKQSGLISDDTQALLLNNDFIEMPITKVKTIKVGNVVLENRPVIITQTFENYDRILGIHIHGIIGLDLFGKFTTELNFDNQQIYLGNGLDTIGYKSINTNIYNELFYINATIYMSDTDSISNKFLFDSADMTAASLAQPFWTKFNLLEKSNSHYSGINRNSSSLVSPSYFANFKGLALNGYCFKNIYLNLTSSKKGFFANDSIAGTIGIDVLKRFNIIINLKAQKIYLKPNKKFNEPYRINTTGIRTRLNKELTECVIESVLVHSPADDAGLMTGDLLVSINDVQANQANISLIRQYTRSAPGTELTFIVKRNNEIKKMKLICNNLKE
jgi:hypothetical protein